MLTVYGISSSSLGIGQTALRSFSEVLVSLKRLRVSISQKKVFKPFYSDKKTNLYILFGTNALFFFKKLESPKPFVLDFLIFNNLSTS